MSQRNRFFQQALTNASVLDTAGVLQRDAVPNIRELAVYVVFGPGTLAGAVQIEGAHDPSYTGTWAPIGSPVAWAAASRAHYVAITGAHIAVRVRVSTAIVGGTVNVYAVGN